MQIQITQEHIDHGLQWDRNADPLVIATQTMTDQQVKSTQFVLQVGNTYFENDPDIIQWIEQFDKGQAVKPFTMVLTPNPTNRRGTARMV